jgi:hypothetical protein
MKYLQTPMKYLQTPTTLSLIIIYIIKNNNKRGYKLVFCYYKLVG